VVPAAAAEKVGVNVVEFVAVVGATLVVGAILQLYCQPANASPIALIAGIAGTVNVTGFPEGTERPQAVDIIGGA